MAGETHQNQKQILTEHETFCGDHYLDCGDGVPDVYLSQNLSNGTLYICAVDCSQLPLNQAVKK